MHGLVFVTWEKYLAERFGTSLVYAYRQAIGEQPGETPLVSRVYDDEQLLAGVAAASRLTQAPVDTLLYEYGRYYILNGLTSHLCAYLLNGVHSARDLLLVMRSAHAQMHQAEGITPPLFGYQALPGDPSGLVLSYDSPRQLCSLLRGSIEGAAEHYGERVQVSEETCMKRGAPTCTFAIHFMRPSAPPSPQQPGISVTSHLSRITLSTPERDERWEAQHRLADQVYAILPDTSARGITLAEVQDRVRLRYSDSANAARPFIVLEALNQLSRAGWVATSANEPGDALGNRRYWRVPRVEG